MDYIKIIKSFFLNSLNSIVDKTYEKLPNLKNYGEKGYQYIYGDTKFNILYLIETWSINSDILFKKYLIWLKTTLRSRSIPTDGLKVSYNILIDFVSKIENIPDDIKISFKNFIKNNLYVLDEKGSFIEKSYIIESNPYYSLLKKYFNYILEKKRDKGLKIIIEAAESNIPIDHIYKYVFIPFQYEIGRLWHINKISIAEEHYSTAATQLIMSQLYKFIFTTPKHGGVAVVTCTEGELHELGIRMIADYLEYRGWDTHYLGANLPNIDIKNYIKSNAPNIIAISATIPYQINKVKELINLIKNDNSISNIPIFVGGLPFNIDNTLWKKIGADHFAKDFEGVEKIAKQYI